MDHRYIDEHSVAERYIENTLSKEDCTEFEAHIVDCQECLDRLLLAGMFHARNGHPNPPKPLPFRARFVAQFKPWQLVILLAAAAVFLLAIPTAYFLWELHAAAKR
jgi:hypothetical protein